MHKSTLGKLCMNIIVQNVLEAASSACLAMAAVLILAFVQTDRYLWDLSGQCSTFLTPVYTASVEGLVKKRSPLNLHKSLKRKQ